MELGGSPRRTIAPLDPAWVCRHSIICTTRDIPLCMARLLREDTWECPPRPIREGPVPLVILDTPLRIRRSIASSTSIHIRRKRWGTGRVVGLEVVVEVVVRG